LDPPANVTGGANTPAPDDAMDLGHKRGADWPHWPDRGNRPARRDRLERRLFRDSEREAEIAAASETVRRIEQAAEAKAREIERLEEAVAHLNGNGKAALYLAFVWTPGGYVLHDRLGDVPDVGTRLSLDGHEYAVAKLARSPLPGDDRRCAYLEPL
jgi:hypothetical protein